MPQTTFLRDRPPTRGLIFTALTETGYTLSSTYTSDGGGGGTATATTGGTVACRLDALTGSEDETGAALSDRSTHLVTLPPGTAITVADDFVISGRGTFEVTAVRENTDELARYIEVVASA